MSRRTKHYPGTFILTLIILALSFIVALPTTSYSWTLTDLLWDGNIQPADAKNPAFNIHTDIQGLPTLKGKNFFEAINDLSICRHPEVRQFLFLYLTRGREYTLRAIERSRMYLPIIDEVFRQHPKIPPEIRLLPLLESAFNPKAVSRSRAVGIWQFLQGTARMLDMKINKWTDERCHITKSTEAAVRHLQSLRSVFPSWELALAAYNGGAGYVKRTMIRTRSATLRDLLESGELRRETREYVYRFAALAIIYKNPELFQISDELKPIKVRRTETVTLEYPVKLTLFCRVTGVSLNDIRLYNPELRRGYAPRYERNYTLRIPEGFKERVMAQEDKLYSIKYSRLQKHVVRKGDNLGRIAKRYGTKRSWIILFNDIQNGKKLQRGSTLYIPI